MKTPLNLPGFAAFLAACLGITTPVRAASDTWNGTSLASGNWSDKTNWNGATVASGDQLFFGGTARLASTNNFSGYSFSGVTFNSGAGLFNLNGNPFDLTGGITNSSTSAQTIKNNLTLSAGNHVIYAPASTASITNSGNISEDGSGSASLTFLTPGSETLVLNGSNSITGGLVLTGTSTTKFGLVLGNTNALPTNWVDVTSGAINLFAVTPGANPYVISTLEFTNLRDGYFNGSNILFTGTFYEGGAGKQINVASGQTVTLSNGLVNLSGAHADKSGPGTLVLDGALSGATPNVTENGVSYATGVEMYNSSGGGTLVLGNPGAVGPSSCYYIIDAGNGATMANTDLSGANAVTANLLLSAANGTPVGHTIGGVNNLSFAGNLNVSIGTGGTATRYLTVTNTAVTAFLGNVNLSDGNGVGTLLLNVPRTAGGVYFSGAIADGNTGGGSLILTNAGTVTLSGPNYYTGSTTINGGQLWVNAQGASQSSTFVVNASDGLVFSNDTAFVLGGLSGTGSFFLTNNLGSPVSLTVGDNNASTTYSGALTDGGAGGTLTKTGSGVLTLAGANNYTGLTTVNQGTLVISPAYVAGGSFTVNEGAIFSVSTNTAATSAQLGTLQFGTLGGGTTTMLFSGLPAPARAPLTINTITPTDGTSNIIVAINSSLNVGTYNLINYTSLGGDGFSDFAPPTLPAGTQGYLQNNTAVTPNVIQLVVTSTAQELWSGTVSSNWDFSTYNWKLNGVATNYTDLGPVRFDDSSSQPLVNLAATVQPFSILVTNNTKSYSFGSYGYYIYGPATLTKSGTGSLTLANLNNTFTGDVFLNGGTVTLLTSTLGGGNVTLNSGTLVVSDSTLGSGNVTLNGGPLFLSDDTVLTNNITDDTSIVSSSGTQSLSGNLAGSGSLTLNGTDPANDSLTLSGLNNTYGGGTIIESGTLIQGASLPTLGSGTITFGDGVSTNDATLAAAYSLTVPNNIVVVPGGTGTYSIIATNTYSGSVVASNGLTIVGSVFLTGPVSGPGTITAAGGGGCRITSTGNANFTGGLVISNNCTFKTVNGALNTNTVVTVDLGSTYDTLAQASTIAGLNDGPDGGGYVVPAGALLTLGGSGSYACSGDITNSGSLLLIGSGTQTLSGENDYTGSTTISNGTLVINGILTGGGSVTVAGGTLAGTGVLTGPTTVSSGTLAPAGPGVTGTLTISNTLTLQSGSTLAVAVDAGNSTNDVITGLTSATFGGTLAVTNLTGTLTTSDSFPLFSAGSYSGAFASIIPATPGAGLAWNTSTLTTDGTLRIAVYVAPPLSGLKFTTGPTISGTTLTISATNSGAGTVYLLTSTNLTSPINTWTPIWTNILTGSGSFTTNLLNAVNPALKQEFYLLGNTNN